MSADTFEQSGSPIRPTAAKLACRRWIRLKIDKGFETASGLYCADCGAEEIAV